MHWACNSKRALTVAYKIYGRSEGAGPRYHILFVKLNCLCVPLQSLYPCTARPAVSGCVACDVKKEATCKSRGYAGTYPRSCPEAMGPQSLAPEIVSVHQVATHGVVFNSGEAEPSFYIMPSPGQTDPKPQRKARPD